MFEDCFKFFNLKTKLRKCNEEAFGNIDLQFNETEKRLGEIDEKGSLGLGNEDLNLERKQLRTLLEDLICKKEQMLNQKAKVKWIREGDNNTIFSFVGQFKKK